MNRNQVNNVEPILEKKRRHSGGHQIDYLQPMNSMLAKVWARQTSLSSGKRSLFWNRDTFYQLLFPRNILILLLTVVNVYYQKYWRTSCRFLTQNTANHAQKILIRLNFLDNSRISISAESF
jgi:hypothetical protein